MEDSTEVTARDPNIETDVRAIVARIVDGVLAGDVPAHPPEGDGAAPEDVHESESSGTSTIAIGADHGGFAMKERLGFKLKEQGFVVIDCGTDSSASVDYPDFAEAVARAVASGSADLGIMVDGAGIGSSMVGNKVPGVRAALCYDVSTARNAREHNHANMLTLGAALIGDGLAWQITQEFLSTPFGPGRHARRVEMIDALDRPTAGVT